MQIELSQKQEAGFLLQMRPNEYLCAIGPFSKGEKGSLFCPSFFSPLEEGYKPCFQALFSKTEVLDFLNPGSEGNNLAKLAWASPNFSHFKSFFSKALNQMQSDELKKVVPVLFETAEYSPTGPEILALVNRLISHSDSTGRVYAYWSDEKVILGQSPEYLFQKQDNYIQTMALAGTACNLEHNLLEDSKEMLEHQYVVDELKNTLNSLGEFRNSPTYVHVAGALRHLRTDFKLIAKQPSPSFKKLCQLLHPTPALGGFPKQKALKLLKEFHKDYPRHNFGAPFGAELKEKSLCLVAIRNIQFIKGKAYIGSGCGLVKDSQLDREWEELKKKRQVIKDILF